MKLEGKNCGIEELNERDESSVVAAEVEGDDGDDER